jgi:hypothetical protein
MRWHASEEAKSPQHIMRYTHDSPAWKHVDRNWPQFAEEPRNIRFGLAMDGINPYKLMKTKYSVWPVLLINYNIPPWLAIKKGHVMLPVIIPGVVIAPKCLMREFSCDACFYVVFYDVNRVVFLLYDYQNDVSGSVTTCNRS